MEKKYIIYKHTNLINGKVYIGQTSNTIEYRSGTNGCKYRTQPKFYNAILKYGWINFDHQIIEKELTKEEANIREEYWIKQYDATNENKGYNICCSGKTGNVKIDGIKKAVGRKIVCYETGQVFDTLIAAAKWCGLSANGANNINAQIKGLKKSAGKHPITGEQLHWYDYGNDPSTVKINLVKKPGARPVINLDTLEEFDSINAASRASGISNVSILKSCKSQGALAVGKSNKKDTVKFHWIYKGEHKNEK